MILILLLLFFCLPVGADKIHRLEDLGRGKTRVVLHAPIPSGNNRAGVSFKDIQGRQIAAKIAGCTDAGTRTTFCVGSSLSVGAGPNQISQGELDQIVSGDLVELLGDLETRSCGGTPACLNELADKVIADRLVIMTRDWDNYGQRVP